MRVGGIEPPMSKINIHCLDSPWLALQDDTIFVGNDVIKHDVISSPFWISKVIRKQRKLFIQIFIFDEEN